MSVARDHIFRTREKLACETNAIKVAFCNGVVICTHAQSCSRENGSIEDYFCFTTAGIECEELVISAGTVMIWPG